MQDVTRVRHVNPLDVFVDLCLVLLYLEVDIGLQHGLYVLLANSQGKNFCVEALFTSLKFIQLVWEGLGDFDPEVLSELDSESDILSAERRKIAKGRQPSQSPESPRGRGSKKNSDSTTSSSESEHEVEIKPLSLSENEYKPPVRKNLISLASRPAPKARLLQVLLIRWYTLKLTPLFIINCRMRFKLSMGHTFVQYLSIWIPSVHSPLSGHLLKVISFLLFR